ncbi:ThiF family adenylyltransferase [Candidatus Woesearchaeota archaeon]|nr:ThiF family adenylyltransferase [Candidatus Woesearchaeota archaeon]
MTTKKIAIVGIGALGTAAAELLARSGIGTLQLIDRDVVEENNLHRQLLFTENDLEKSKAEIAKEKLKEINTSLKIESRAIHLNSKNISLLEKSDIVLDCTDNLQTRFLLNDFCKKNKIPLIYGAAIKTSGYVYLVLPEGPCLSCFLKEASLETCNTVGVLNTITTSIAEQQVTLALKVLLQKDMSSELHYTNIWNSEFKRIKINKNKNCKTCQGEYLYLTQKEETELIRFCGSGRYQVQGKIQNLDELKMRLEKAGEVLTYGETVSFKNILLFKDGRALIKAKSEEEALAIYGKWVGN